MLNAAAATDRYQPRPGDAPHPLFQKRLTHCQKCPLRSGHKCQPANQLATVLARPAAGYCPVGKWGRRPQPRASALAISAPRAEAQPQSDNVTGPFFAASPLELPAIDTQKTVRNLVCHMYPRTAGQKWRRTVSHLAARRELFNGRRIIAVATDHECDTAAEVRAAFRASGLDAEYLELANDGARGEVASFVPMLERIENTAPGEITFYCHSKGSTWPQAAASAHEWADVMFAACLDYPALVAEALSTAAVAGAFRTHRPIFQSGWHYSGTFFWFRHDAIFAAGTPGDRRWRCVQQTYGGVEDWPGLQVPIEHSACLFFEDAEPVFRPERSPYTESFWESTVRPVWHKFRKARRTAWGNGPPIQHREEPAC